MCVCAIVCVCVCVREREREYVGLLGRLHTTGAAAIGKTFIFK